MGTRIIDGIEVSDKLEERVISLWRDGDFMREDVAEMTGLPLSVVRVICDPRTVYVPGPGDRD